MKYDCKTCNNTRHVSVPGKNLTRRCPDCYAIVFDSMYVKPGIRGRNLTYPEHLNKFEPWPLDGEVLIGGDPKERQKFKEMAWRSLAAYRGLLTADNYDLFDLARYREIHFERDPKYPNVGAVHQLKLVILSFGDVDGVKSDYSGELLAQLISRRRDEGKGLWMFTPLRQLAIRERYGFVVGDLLDYAPSPAY